MIHLFIDTNVFVKACCQKQEIKCLKIIIKLLEYGVIKLYINDVLIKEFENSFEKKIKGELSNFDDFNRKGGVPSIIKTAFESCNDKTSLELVTEYKKLQTPEMHEKILSSFYKLYRNNLVEDLFNRIKSYMKRNKVNTEVSQEIREKAQARTDAGYAPGKPKMLNDRMHWEFLLHNIPKYQDLHIITDDKDFYDNVIIRDDNMPNKLLRNDLSRQSGFNLYCYNTLSDFCDRILVKYGIHLDFDLTKVNWEIKANIAKLIHAYDIKDIIESINVLSSNISELSDDDLDTIAIAGIWQHYALMHLEWWFADKDTVTKYLDNIDQYILDKLSSTQLMKKIQPWIVNKYKDLGLEQDLLYYHTLKIFAFLERSTSKETQEQLEECGISKETCVQIKKSLEQLAKAVHHVENEFPDMLDHIATDAHQKIVNNFFLKIANILPNGDFKDELVDIYGRASLINE